MSQQRKSKYGQAFPLSRALAENFSPRTAQFSKTAVAVKIARTMPGASIRAIAKEMRKLHPRIFSSVEDARSIARYAFGVKTPTSRIHRLKSADSDLVRPLMESGWKPSQPPRPDGNAPLPAMKQRIVSVREYKAGTKAAHAAHLVKLYPSATARCLARILVKDHPDLFSTLENARSCVRYVVGRIVTK